MRLKSLFENKPSIVAAYIFGSYSKGKQTAKSDLDIGLICTDKAAFNQFKMSLEIDNIIRFPTVDLVICDLDSDPFLLSNILNGVVVYQKSVTERSTYEATILKLIEDNNHYQKIKDYYLNRSFKEGIYVNRQKDC